MFDDARTVWELIERRAAASPNRVMLYDGDRETTFAEYRDLVLEAAAGYREFGIGSGVNVSWQLPTWTESAVLVGALCRLGAVQNPMLPIYRKRELSFITGQLGTQFLITPSTWGNFDYATLAKEVALERPGLQALVADRHNPSGDPAGLDPATEVDDPADAPSRWVFYTSGTTADPKGAQHTDLSVMAASIGYARKTHVVEDDVALVAFPFTHVGGIIIGVFTPLLTGSAAVLMEAWTAAKSTELIRRHGVTLGNGAPAIHTALLAEAKADPDAYRTVRAFPSGGSAKPPPLHFDLMAAVPSATAGITSGYGLTEIPILSQTDVDAPDSSKRDGEGTPNEGVRIRLVDRDLNEVPDGAEGELTVIGPSLMRGYTDESLMAAAFTPDGYFRTGDLARLDEHGAVIITGRLKDIIIRKGENVSAKEVEDTLYAFDKVADVSVLGIPDAERGEMVVAVVVPSDPADPPTLPEVFEHCKGTGLMLQKIPERLELIDAIPRNPSGKVPKHELRARILGE